MTLEVPEPRKGPCPHCGDEGLIHPPKWHGQVDGIIAEIYGGNPPPVQAIAFPCPWCAAGEIEKMLLSEFPSDGRVS